jgi:methyltransferase (TIGR00027 family)
MEEAHVPTGIGKTALGVAMVRAEESRSDDCLFNDPYAQAFLDAAPGAFAAEEQAAFGDDSDMGTWGAVFWTHAIIRTRFFDDYLVHATTAHGIRQVVILAAGLDTRAFRLAWPAGVHLFELDLPEVLAFKESVLAEHGARAACERTLVAIDLRQDWATPLAGAGFHPGEATVWLAEGLMIYLSEEEAAELLTLVGSLSRPASQVAFEIENLDSDPLRARVKRGPLMQQYTKLWKGGLPAAPLWLAAHGWKPQIHERSAVAASYQRSMPGPSTGGFLVAVRS